MKNTGGGRGRGLEDMIDLGAGALSLREPSLSSLHRGLISSATQQLRLDDIKCVDFLLQRPVRYRLDSFFIGAVRGGLV